MVTDPARFGLAGAADAVRAAFPMVGAWWLLFTIPCLFWVRDEKPAAAPAAGGAPKAGWREFRATLHEVRKYRPLVWFLLAYWLYIDGVNTVIRMAVDYGLSLGFPQQSLIAALLITQFVGFPPALAFGWLGRRHRRAHRHLHRDRHLCGDVRRGLPDERTVAHFYAARLP